MAAFSRNTYSAIIVHLQARSKVSQADMTVDIQEDIVGLNVSVGEIRRMSYSYLCQCTHRESCDHVKSSRDQAWQLSPLAPLSPISTWTPAPG